MTSTDIRHSGHTFESNPVLTVAVPSYNVEKYLNKGLSTFDDDRFDGRLQVIVVNDGSTDSTSRIASEFKSARPAVFQSVDKENGGHGSAINVALELARGKYFRVVDGDDWVDTDELSDFLDLLEGSDADLVVDVRTDVDMASGDEALRLPQIPFSYDKTFDFDEVCSNDAASDVISIHTLTVRTESIRQQQLKLLEKTFYEDYEYIVKATAFASTVMFSDKKVYKYLLGNAAQSVADASYAKRWDDHSRVTSEVLRFYEETQHEFSDARRVYLQKKIDLLINTHYNIALIFDHDRKRGLKRAKDFRAYLKDRYPDFAARSDKRYHQARILHSLGIDSQKKLDRLTGRS